MVSRCLDFNLFDAFRLLDLQERGILTPDQFLSGLTTGPLNLFPISSSDVELFFRRYDRDRLGLIRFSDFTCALMPVGDPDLARMLEKRKSNPWLEGCIMGGSAFFEQGTLELYRRLLMTIIKAERVKAHD
jgi:hypothetical protein